MFPAPLVARGVDYQPKGPRFDFPKRHRFETNVKAQKLNCALPKRTTLYSRI